MLVIYTYIKFLARGVLSLRTTKLKELKVNEQAQLFALVGYKLGDRKRIYI